MKQPSSGMWIYWSWFSCLAKLKKLKKVPLSTDLPADRLMLGTIMEISLPKVLTEFLLIADKKMIKQCV